MTDFLAIAEQRRAQRAQAAGVESILDRRAREREEDRVLAEFEAAEAAREQRQAEKVEHARSVYTAEARDTLAQAYIDFENAVTLLVQAGEKVQELRAPLAQAQGVLIDAGEQITPLPAAIFLRATQDSHFGLRQTLEAARQFVGGGV